MAASAAPPGLSFETVGRSRPPQDEEVSDQPIKAGVSDVTLRSSEQ
jgi:hypothetical protein